jgi:cell division control protein 45
MVRDLNKANNDYLWYAIVGLTSMYLDHKITKEVLDFLSQIYKLDVVKFNQQGQKKEKGDISSKRGYQFTLMDHWSLYDSMLYSNYLMTKLFLWEDRGLNKLHEFIHTIGISLQESRQLYKYMSLDSQRKL